ncbi:MAG: hypothetical protein QNJ78_09935 [Gammaproteobacteria bacterium]|nr:hypothetical protein [Gammaproteobacteria bacterium]
MKHSPKAVTFPIVLALALTGGTVFAEEAPVTAEQIKAGLPAEVAKDAKQFANEGEVKTTEQVRERVGEDNAKGVATRERKELKEQQEKQAKHQHKHQKKLGEQTKTQDKSGSFGAFSGKGPGGGAGGGGKR